jgi:hypothetical protein
MTPEIKKEREKRCDKGNCPNYIQWTRERRFFSKRIIMHMHRCDLYKTLHWEEILKLCKDDE